MIFSNLNSNWSNLLDMRNIQEQVKKTCCYQKLFWPFTVWIKCSSDLKNFANSRPSASNFKSVSRSLEQFFLTVCQNNFGNKIPFLRKFMKTRILFQKRFQPIAQKGWVESSRLEGISTQATIPRVNNECLASFKNEQVPFKWRIQQIHVG